MLHIASHCRPDQEHAAHWTTTPESSGTRRPRREKGGAQTIAAKSCARQRAESIAVFTAKPKAEGETEHENDRISLTGMPESTCGTRKSAWKDGVHETIHPNRSTLTAPDLHAEHQCTTTRLRVLGRAQVLPNDKLRGVHLAARHAPDGNAAGACDATRLHCRKRTRMSRAYP